MYEVFWTIKFEVGCVSRICFWLDPWVSLKGPFLAPFSIALNKDTLMWHTKCVGLMELFVGIIHWDNLFARSVHDWKMEILQYFLGLLYSHKIGRAWNDHIYWIPARSSIFEVKSYCKAFSNENLHISLKWESPLFFQTWKSKK